MSEKPTSQLPYEGERCDVCGSLATRIVNYQGDNVALCRTCKAATLFL